MKVGMDGVLDGGASRGMAFHRASRSLFGLLSISSLRRALDLNSLDSLISPAKQTEFYHSNTDRCLVSGKDTSLFHHSETDDA